MYGIGKTNWKCAYWWLIHVKSSVYMKHERNGMYFKQLNTIEDN